MNAKSDTLNYVRAEQKVMHLGKGKQEDGHSGFGNIHTNKFYIIFSYIKYQIFMKLVVP